MEVKKLRWDRMDVPKKATYAATGDYQVSKQVTRHLPKLEESGDNICGNVAVSCNIAHRELYLTEKRLENRRKLELEERKSLDGQWAELERKEAELRQSFIEFNKFITENSEKRTRALSQIENQRQLCLSHSEKINALVAECRELKEAQQLMNEKVNENQIYENFLNRVVEKNPELFNDVFDVFKRYETLMYSKNLLSWRQISDLDTIQKEKERLNKVVDGYVEKMEMMHTKVAVLSQRYESVRKNCLEWETVLLNARGEITENLLEVDEVKTSCRHVYEDVCSRMGVEPEFKGDYQKQLECIKKALRSFAYVNEQVNTMRELTLSERAVASGDTK